MPILPRAHGYLWVRNWNNSVQRAGPIKGQLINKETCRLERMPRIRALLLIEIKSVLLLCISSNISTRNSNTCLTHTGTSVAWKSSERAFASAKLPWYLAFLLKSESALINQNLSDIMSLQSLYVCLYHLMYLKIWHFWTMDPTFFKKEKNPILREDFKLIWDFHCFWNPTQIPQAFSAKLYNLSLFSPVNHIQ